MAFSYVASYAQLSFSGASREVIAADAESSTGLDAIYVAYEMDGLSADYVSADGRTDVRWLIFDERGGGFAEELSAVERNGSVSSVRNMEGNRGYIIEDGSERLYFWVVDYSTCRFRLRGATFPDEQDCGLATMSVDADCEPVVYYSLTGVRRTLGRDVTVSYATLEWSEENLSFNSADVSLSLDGLDERTVVAAPLCNTTFTISGDRFLREWGEEESFTTDTYMTSSIDVRTTATQEERNNENEQNEETSTLGGSAPVTVSFRSYTTDAVEHREWQFSKTSDFSTIDYRFNEDDLDYTFRENGTTYVKFIASNGDASCSVESDVYTVAIGESVLECPNVFSPDASPGVNDEWKVSYKSIVSFQCWIFDRYGNQITKFSDPSAGWDGKYKGKYVKPGVYFYVIEAAGADGKQYKLKGDINILRSTQTGNETTGE